MYLVQLDQSKPKAANELKSSKNGKFVEKFLFKRRISGSFSRELYEPGYRSIGLEVFYQHSFGSVVIRVIVRSRNGRTHRPIFTV